MKRTEYLALKEEFPEGSFSIMFLFNAWVDEFYKSISICKASEFPFTNSSYVCAEGLFHKISGFLWCLYGFGSIDDKRRELLIDEFVSAFNF